MPYLSIDWVCKLNLSSQHNVPSNRSQVLLLSRYESNIFFNVSLGLFSDLQSFTIVDFYHKELSAFLEEYTEWSKVYIHYVIVSLLVFGFLSKFPFAVEPTEMLWNKFLLNISHPVYDIVIEAGGDCRKTCKKLSPRKSGWLFRVRNSSAPGEDSCSLSALSPEPTL